MNETPKVRIDPQQLQETPRVELGEEETPYDALTSADHDDAQRVAAVTETTAGAVPPAR